MGRLIMGVITIGIVGYIGYRTMYGRMPGAQTETSAPKRQLENVRGAAQRIEDEQQKAAEKALEKSNAE
jgi:hypothetical protein